MRSSVRQRYEAMVQSGAVVADPAQRRLAGALDELANSLEESRTGHKKSALGWLFARNARSDPTRGLYIWGGVGRGKTLLMDLFYEAAPPVPKRRVHFNEFMGEVHARADAVRKRSTDPAREHDPIRMTAIAIASEIKLLCFDEFAVNDIADAMIIGRLFAELFARGVVVVATSNVPPDRLYEAGLNRALFEPFIEALKTHVRVFNLEAAQDYRHDRVATAPLYVTPLGRQADLCLDGHFRRLTGCQRGRRRELVHLGHRIEVPETVNGVARFDFDDLCVKPLGAGDYLAIASAFDTIILDNVPVLPADARNEARRLILLVDTLYDKHVRLIVSAAAEPEDLWQGEEGAETFEFERTRSRLAEMRSDSYWRNRADDGSG